MERLIGMLLILTGVGGMLLSWHEKKYRQLAVMQAAIRLFSRWQYALTKEQMRLYDFLEACEGEFPELSSLLREVRERLQENRYPSGALVWQQVLGQQRSFLSLEPEASRILMDAADGFFGNTRETCIRCMEVCRCRMEEELKKEKSEMDRRWKVYMPVGMLGGVILIILLI